MTRILCLPTLCADIFDVTGNILPGGEALNFACIACCYPHIDVGLLGAIGDDEPGRHILRVIDEHAIRRENVHIVPGGATATHRIYHTPEGDRFFKPDSWQGGVFAAYRLTEEDAQVIRAHDVVFTTYYSPNFPQVMDIRRSSGFRLAVDFDVCRDYSSMEALLPWIDFFLISGDESVLPVAKAWSEKYDGLFNVTLAAQGSVTYLHGKEYRVQAIPVDTVIDTTGCGDSYHAGFVCSWLKDGDIIAAMNEGSRVASQTLGHIGGF